MVWAKQFRKGVRDIPPERIEAVLLWYIEHIGGGYIPQAFCPRSFCDKFIRLEIAHKRWMADHKAGG